MTRLPATWRLVPAAIVGWALAGVGIGFPHAAPAVLACAVVGAVGLTIAAVRVRALALAAVASWVAVLVATSIAAAAPARAPAEWREAAASGRSVELEVVVSGRADEGRFPATIAGSRVPVLVFGATDAPPPAIGTTVALRADLEATPAGEDVAFLAFPRDDGEVVAEPPPLLAWAHGIRASFLEVSHALPAPGGELLPGLAIGDTTRVPESLDAAMIASSLSHLTAVSGANCRIGGEWI